MSESIQKENLFRTVVEEIRGSLDIDTTKQKIVEIIGQTLNADRCFIVDYDKSTDTFSIVKDEYLSSDEITGYAGTNVNEDVPNFMEEFKKGNYLVVDNKKIFINHEPQDYEAEKDTIEKVNVNSAYGFPLFYDGELHGVLGIHYLSDNHNVSQSEIKLLISISEQIAIAIYHAKLYKKIKEQVKRENLLKDIIDKIRSSLDIEETLYFICEETAKLLNVQRVAITMIPDIDNIESYIVKKEYVLSSEIKGIDNLVDPSKVFYYWADKLLRNNEILAIDNVEKSDTPYYFKLSYLNTGIKSLIGIPIQRGPKIWGILVLSEYNNYRHWDEKDKDLLSIIANQTFIAINQAEMYEREKVALEREKLLRQIIETIRSTFDIVEIKQKVITEIAKTLNANRCYIAEFDKNTEKHLPITQEYLASPDIKSIIGFDVEKNIPEMVKFVKDKPLVLIPNVDKFVESNKFSNVISNYFSEFDIKSRVYAQISYMGEFFGTLVVNFPQKREKFEQEDVDFIETLANQIGIVMYQSELYNYSQLQVKREKLLGAILVKSISTFDINQIKPIVREIGVLAKADRCYFVEAKEEALSGKQIYYDGEYLASPDVKSAIGYTFPAEDVHKFVQMYLEAKDLIVFDYEEILENTDAQFEGMRNYIRRFGLKSGIGIPLFYNNKLHAVLAIEYTKEKVLPSNDELDFYRLVGNQASLVLNQIKFFENTKKRAEREMLIRKIIEIIRSSLDLEETFSFICEETAKLFSVQRVAISEMFPPYDVGKFIPRKEYKINQSIKGLDDVYYPKEASAYIAQMVLDKGINLVINNFEKSNTPDFFKKAYNEMGVMSAVCLPIKKENKKWGTIFLAEYNYYREWTEEDIYLLEIIAGQIYIAINQAELYEKEKQSAERERISRNIIEILRSSIDKTIIKKLFVKNIGKFFNADRVFFSEYDSSNSFYLPVDKDSEYLSNPNEKSFVGFDWSNPDIQSWIQPLLEKREIKIVNWNEYINQGHEISDYILSLYKDSNLKSKYGFPVIYQNNIMGFFCLEFTQKVCELSDEDIGRIRSICTQAGIALYHSELYVKAQRCASSKSVIDSELSEKIFEPSNNILKISNLLAQNEFERQVQLDYLNNIIASCNQLIELTKRM